MVLIGLTGGIASGKSTVARLLEQKGAAIIDADRIGHEVLKVPDALDRVVARFGAGILGDDGAIDRAKLGAVVFADPAARRDLEAITHPLISAEIARRIAEHAATDRVVVLDAALLVEAFDPRRDLGLDRVVVVSAFPEEQLERMVRDRGMSAEDARARMAAQAPAERKLSMADIVIHNRGTIEQLEESVETLWTEISELGG